MNYQKRMIDAIRLIFIISAVYLLCLGKMDRQILLWGSLLLTYVPEIFTKFTKVQIPIWTRVCYTLFLFGSQFLGSFLGAYTYFGWWDTMLHSVSGILIGYIALIIILTVDRKATLFKEYRIGLIVTFILAITIASAGIWEMIEFTGDTLFGLNAQLGSLQDTMKDIICGTIGGAIYALYMGIIMKRGKRCCIDTLLEVNGISKKK